MQRISTATRVLNKFGAGKDGFTNGNVIGGVPATDLEDGWFDHVQEEIANVVEAAGLVLSGADRTQLLQAIRVVSMPAGGVVYFARNTAPSGYLKANGALISRTTYANLFAAIGTTFGVGDGATTFAIPDLRGEFIRAWDDGRGIDPARVFGSAQVDAFKSHVHNIPTQAVTPSTGGTGESVNGSGANLTPSTATGGTETRPRNIAHLACIKF